MGTKERMRVRASRLIILGIIVATAVVLVPLRAVGVRQNELLMTVWGMPFEDLLFRDVYARGFEALHPGVRVRYERYPRVMPKYEAWHAVGSGADVMRTPITDLHAMVAKGMVEPLDRFLDDPEIGLTRDERADFLPWVWEALWIDGHLYALPQDNAHYGLYYNKDLFDAHNATHPTQRVTYPSAAWTWDDLARANELLTRRGSAGAVIQYGTNFDLWAWPFFAFLKQAGGDVWDVTRTTTRINSDAGVEALEFIVSLIPPDAPIRTDEMPDTASGPDDLFKVGKLALLLDGSWRAPNIELDNPDLNFAIAPLPHHRRQAVMSGSVVWTMSVHSHNKPLAWRMIKWLAEREQSLAYWDKLRVAPPARLSVVRSAAFRSTGGIVQETGGARRVFVPPMPRSLYPERAAWLEHAITPDPETGRMPGFIPVGRYQWDLEQKVARALMETVRGEKSARAALDDAAAAVHAIIDRDRASRGLAPVPRRP